jgi:hypothetical protein
MAVSRYDQRKNLEEAETNTIGTEYVRADLLPPADAATVRALLKSYVDQRVARLEPARPWCGLNPRNAAPRRGDNRFLQ